MGTLNLMSENLGIVFKVIGAGVCVGLIAFSIYVIIDIYNVWMDEEIGDIEIEDEEDDNDLGIFMQ